MKQSNPKNATMDKEKEMTMLLHNDDVICIKNQHYDASKQCHCKTRNQISLVCSLVAVFLFVLAVYLIDRYVNETKHQETEILNKDIDSLSYLPCGNLTMHPRCASGTNCLSRLRRLIGGTESRMNWPWMVEIVYNNKHFCGAVLITQNLILTAAHCLFHDGQRIYRNNLEVKLGSNYKMASDIQAQTLKISKIIIHHSFKLSTLENDIAALELEENVLFSKSVWPICLSGLAKFKPGTKAVMIGWGKTQYGGEFSPLLKEAKVPVVSSLKCRKANRGLFSNVSVSIKNNICVGYGKSRPEYGCNGDSGGPLMAQIEDKRWTLIGLMSWGGPECSSLKTESFTVFTKLYSYRTWIERILK